MKNVIIVLLLIALGVSLFYLHQNVLKRRELAEMIVGISWIRDLTAYELAQRTHTVYESYKMSYSIMKDYKKPFRYRDEKEKDRIMAYYILHMADCQYAMGNYKKALNLIDEALNLENLSYYKDTYSWVRLYKAKILYKQDKTDEADKIFEKIKDNNFGANITMAEIYLEKNDVKKAMEMIEKANENYEKYLIFARYYYDKKNYDKANDYIDKGIASIDKERLNLRGEFAFYLETLYLMKSAIEYEENNIDLAKKYYKKASSITTYSNQEFTIWIAGRELPQKTINELQKIKDIS